LLDHSRWFFCGGKMDLHMMGRSYARQSDGTSVLKGMLMMAQVNGPRREEAAQSAIAVLGEGKSRELDLTSAGLADKISEVAGSQPLGFRYWPSGEIAAFNQPEFHVGLRQYSSR